MARQVQLGGLVVITLSGWMIVKRHAYSLMVGIVFGFVFFAVGTAINWFMNIPIVFDRSRGLFLKQCRKPDQDPTQVPAPGAGISLNQIHAIQLLTKRVLSHGVQGRGD